MTKHFNQGNVWGRLLEYKISSSPNATPSVGVHIDCAGQYGNINVYGKIWGQQKVDQFLTYNRNNPGTLLKFTGFFSQYFKGVKDYMNFSFYKWNVAGATAPRAAFILKGDVSQKEVRDDAGLIHLNYIKEGTNGYRDTTENFKLWILDPEIYESFTEGDLVEVKGIIQQGEGEDEFGSFSGDVRPVIKVARVIN